MKTQDDKARVRTPTVPLENVRIGKAAHQSRAPAESAPQRFKRLVHEVKAARTARDARGRPASLGTLSLWKRELG
jgi:hypothetical protein